MTYRFSRKLVGSMVGFGLLVLAIGSATSASAAAPAPVPYPYGYAAYGCPVGYGCAPAVYGSIPDGATFIPGVGYAYKDNRYCGDGNVVFTGGGYVCANGHPLYATNGAYPYVVGAPYVFANTVVNPVVPVAYYAPLYR